jgi:hypothetical protein
VSDIDTNSSSPNNIATFATFERFVESLPSSEKVSVFKLYSLAREGKLPVYRLPGVKSACVKTSEARAVLAALSAQGKIRRGYGTFGPDAVVRDLTNVVGQDFEVLQ